MPEPVRKDICGDCETPFEPNEERWQVTGRRDWLHTSSSICIRRLKERCFTVDEVRTLAGITANYINEQGSILNDYDLIGAENRLRAKLHLPLIEGEKGVGDANLAQSGMTDAELEDACKPACTCHPMVEGTNPDCLRHGLKHLQPRCDKPAPQGYAPCTRELGHDGPCALPFAKGGPNWD